MAKKTRPNDNSRKRSGAKQGKSSAVAKPAKKTKALKDLKDLKAAKAAKAIKAVKSLKKKALAARVRPAAASESARQRPRIKIKTPLNKNQLKEFRDILLSKRRALVGDMTGIAAEALHSNRQDGSGDLSNMPTHPADIGTDNYEQEFTLGLLESERVLLREINEALERIDNSTYGVCLGTGEPINLARLRARPWAKYGIEYARMLEKGLVRPPEGHRQYGEDDEDDHDDDRDDRDGVEVSEIESADAGEDDED